MTAQLRTPLKSYLLCATVLVCVALFFVVSHAQEDGPASPGAPRAEGANENERARDAQRAAALRDSLTDIQTSIEDKRREIQDLRDAVARGVPVEGFAGEDEIKARVQALSKEIGDLRRSFEQIATAGVDKSIFADVPEEKFDWQAELVEISKPIFDELRAITEKPRQTERLRRELANGSAQLEAADKALAELARIDRTDMAEAVVAGVDGLTSQWRKRREETERAMEVAQLQLDNLQSDEAPLWDRISAQAVGFVQGRGLALAVALASAIVVWLLMHGLLGYIEKKLRRAGRSHTGNKYRLFVYGHRLISIVAVTGAVLFAFSVMGDFLLLTLAILAIALFVISVRKVLPDYIAEARLLIGIGPVREGERIVYEGLPYEVKTINVYSVLRNPKLESIVRLPLRALIGMVSRPCKEEPWFPTTAGDYVLLPDASFGEVMRQTPEIVELRVLGGMTQIQASADFYMLGVKNISGGESFVVLVTFGIDYRHQAISQDEVVPKLHEALESSLGGTEYGKEVREVLVEFKEAAASSLDYLIIVTMAGSAAEWYYAIGRKVQQICVDVCNRESWGIPFAQLTVHQGEGFEALRAPPASRLDDSTPAG